MFFSLLAMLFAVSCLWFGLQEPQTPLSGLFILLGCVQLFGLAIILSSTPNS